QSTEMIYPVPRLQSTITGILKIAQEQLSLQLIVSECSKSTTVFMPILL
ncbi:MAG: hypothetical protein ACI9RU_003160, partial [Litorivivens sp.]